MKVLILIAEEAVNEVKRQAMIELERVVVKTSKSKEDEEGGSESQIGVQNVGTRDRGRDRTGTDEHSRRFLLAALLELRTKSSRNLLRM